MPSLRGLTVSVGYADLLAITLPRWARRLEECVIVTAPHDLDTQRVALASPNCRLHITDAFTRHGAVFNKGLALEEGFELLGRHGWILAFDADIVLPDAPLPLEGIVPGNLYSAPRRILKDPKKWHSGYDWQRAKLHQEQGMPGYFHLFHADDPHIQELPYGDLTYSHAGGSDGFFQSRWEPERKIWLPTEVLHLGPVDCNWFGRASQLIDGTPGDSKAAAMMSGFKAQKGWIRGRAPAERVQERVIVPGHEPRKWVYARQDV